MKNTTTLKFQTIALVGVEEGQNYKDVIARYDERKDVIAEAAKSLLKDSLVFTVPFHRNAIDMYKGSISEYMFKNMIATATECFKKQGIDLITDDKDINILFVNVLSNDIAQNAWDYLNDNYEHVFTVTV